MINIEQALVFAISNLEDISETPRYDAEILLCAALGKDRSHLLANNKASINDEEFHIFTGFVSTRKKGVPVAYIIKTKGFWDFDLYVDENVLVPRPDTEVLVEKALAELIKSSGNFVLELGIGSGAISLAIARERPLDIIIGTDISYSALLVARKNALALDINNVYFCNTHWLSCINARFDIIVSNPPYLRSDDPHLSTDSLIWEPKSALIAGTDGLSCYKEILSSAKYHLTQDGVLLLEHGYGQQRSVLAIAEHNGFELVESFKDLSGHDRGITVRIART